MGNGKSVFYGCCNNLRCQKNLEAHIYKEDCQIQQDSHQNQEVSYQPSPYKSSTLTLTIISSPTLQKDSTLEFNCYGLIAGRRGKEDGISYFGVKRRAARQSNGLKGCIINDYAIPTLDYDEAKHRYYINYGGKHFYVEYRSISDQYYIKDLGIGFGIFELITATVVICLLENQRQ